MSHVQSVTSSLAAGRYVLKAQLGEGGMATVYRAYDTMLEVERAIKVLKMDLARRQGARTRFLNEAKTMARLRNPNIVNVLDVGVDGQHHYIVMELITGGSLHDRIGRGALPPLMACRVIIGVLEGLHHSHEQGVIHRDIKPHNVMITAGGVPKVMDFGIARVSNTAGATRTGSVMGSFAYMAPELRSDATQAGPASDVYAAGATLFACLTGTPPYDLYNQEMLTNALDGLAPSLGQIITRACDLNPRNRYGSAKAMQAAMEATLTGLPPDPPGVELALPPSSQSNIEARLSTSEHTFPGMDGDDTLLPHDLASTEAGSSPATESPASDSQRPRTGIMAALGVGTVAVLGGLWFIATPAGTQAPVSTVVVIDFDVSGVHQHLGKSLASDLSDALAEQSQWTVVSRRALARYKSGPPDVDQLAADLGVDGVLAGRVVGTGDDLNAHVELIRAGDFSTVWTTAAAGSESALGGSGGIVVTSVLTELGMDGASVSSARQQAQVHYSRGLHHLETYDDEDVGPALEAFRLAIDIDPTYADAHADLARLHVNQHIKALTTGEWDPTRLNTAKEQAEAALKAEPDNPRALRTLARVHLLNADPLSALDELNRAIEADPMDPDGYIDRHEITYETGALELSREDLKIAEKVAPFYLRVYLNAADVELADGKPDEALEIVKRGWSKVGKQPALGYEEAIARRRLGQFDYVITEFTGNDCCEMSVALAHAAKGDSSHVQRMLDTHGRFHRGWMAVSNAVLDNPDGVVTSLQPSRVARGWGVVLTVLDNEPLFAPMQDQPRVKSVVDAGRTEADVLREQVRARWKPIQPQ
jgi:serine/threonine protein kinase/Tfp pilus assembly protein PilF